MKNNMKRAFTLIELLIVIGIIAALSIIFLPNSKYAKDRTRAVTTTKNMETISSMFNLKVARLRVSYRDKTTNELLTAIVQELSTDGTLDKIASPYSKKQNGIGIITGDTYDNTNKLVYILTIPPKTETFPIGTVLIQLDPKTLDSTPIVVE